MNKQDAIKCLKSIQQWVPDFDDREDGLSYWDAIDMAIDALSQPNEPLTCEGCACESYPRDCYPCNTCNRNEETLSDQYRPPEEEDGTR